MHIRGRGKSNPCICSPIHDYYDNIPRTGPQIDFLNNFDSKNGILLAGWYLNGEKESMWKLMLEWKEI
jgi:hypothetical protein